MIIFSDDPVFDCNQANAVACTTGNVIVAPNPCLWGHEFYAALMCHENAHRFGKWRHEKK